MRKSIGRAGVLAVIVFGLASGVMRGEGTAFSYQGQLTEGGQPVSGVYDVRFGLYGAASGGNQVGAEVEWVGRTVSNGLLEGALDFGLEVGGAGARWLQVEVRTNGVGAEYVALVPRQPVLGVPRAVRSQQADTALSVAEGVVGTSALAAGAAVTSVNGLADGVTLEGAGLLRLGTNGTSLVFEVEGWGLRGNAGTGGGAFLGTTDGSPLELKANGVRGLRLTGNTNGGVVNVVAGCATNAVLGDVQGVTIAGGGASYGDGLRMENTVASSFSTIGGGLAITIGADAATSTIGGGSDNHIWEYSESSVIGGGYSNHILPDNRHSVIAGGFTNLIDGRTSVIGGGGENRIGAGARFGTIAGGTGNVIEANAYTGTIGGGGLNQIGAGSYRALIAGGRGNVIESGSPHASVLGGYTNRVEAGAEAGVVVGGISNRVAGAHGLAAGYRAQANGRGSFAWADATEADFVVAGTNEFAVRATGGVRMVTSVNESGAAVSGVTLAAGSGTWATLSDRAAKEEFESVNGERVLEAVVSMPVQTWRYKAESPGVRHMGPTAQDFRQAFGLGSGETTIATVDADGVALAAIQALERRVREQAAEIAELKRLVRLVAADRGQVNAGVGLQDGDGPARP